MQTNVLTLSFLSRRPYFASAKPRFPAGSRTRSGRKGKGVVYLPLCPNWDLLEGSLGHLDMLGLAEVVLSLPTLGHCVSRATGSAGCWTQRRSVSNCVSTKFMNGPSAHKCTLPVCTQGSARCLAETKPRKALASLPLQGVIAPFRGSPAPYYPCVLPLTSSSLAWLIWVLSPS